MGKIWINVKQAAGLTYNVSPETFVDGIIVKTKSLRHPTH